MAGCSPASKRRHSRGRRWSPSCGSCCARCGGSCWWCGMGPPSTAARPSTISWLRVRPRACSPNACPRMRRNSIPPRGSGICSNRGELTNRHCQDLDELRWELGLAVRRLQRQPHRVRGCVAQCGHVYTRPQRSVNTVRERLPRSRSREHAPAIACLPQPQLSGQPDSIHGPCLQEDRHSLQ